MKIALITTTINIPHVLKLYRACGPDVAFFVAGDQKTPHDGVEQLADEVGGYFRYLAPDQQTQWACSDLIGWNTKSRRNIAMLEALKWGADTVVVVDDDNIPMSTDYFDRFEMALGSTFSGPAVGEPASWFDYGQWQFPRDGGAPVVQRGFPQQILSRDPVNSVVDARVGVAQGVVIGDPDTSAVDRMSRRPVVHQISELLKAGVVVNPTAKTVFNSQNTAVVRELAPCFLLPTHLWDRYDDIFMSLITQRVMREKGFHLHVGPPLVWQARNPHNDLRDLKSEIWGMEHIVEFAKVLDDMDLGQAPVVNQVRLIFSRLKNCTWMPPGVSELGLAWCEDVEKVL